MIRSRTWKILMGLAVSGLLFVAQDSVSFEEGGLQVAQKVAQKKAPKELPGPMKKLERETPAVAPQPRRFPDLAVERAWLDSCEIQFQLRNRGPGDVSDADFDRAGAVVYWKPVDSGEMFTRHPSLRDVDRRGDLKRAGGSLRYDTAIRIDKPHYVDVHLDDDGFIRETNERNNRLDPMPVLTPPLQCRRGMLSPQGGPGPRPGEGP